jgi:hypothetical protein
MPAVLHSRNAPGGANRAMSVHGIVPLLRKPLICGVTRLA